MARLIPERFNLEDPEAVAFCTGCGAPFARLVEACVTCGSEEILPRDELLVRLEAQQDESRALAEPVELIALPTEAEAEPVRAALEAAGIRWTEQPDVADGRLFAPAEPALRFFVETRDLERAEAALDETAPPDL